MDIEIQGRQAQNPESLRGVHEQVIKLVDNMVRNYVANLRRAVQRVTRFVDHTRQFGSSGTSQPRQSDHEFAFSDNEVSKVLSNSKLVMTELEQLSAEMQQFDGRWTKDFGKLSGRQLPLPNSPLIDRIPPRGVEMWRDFWDTVRRQMSRINQEVRQMTRDMARMITGRLPSNATPSARSASRYVDLMNSMKADLAKYLGESRYPSMAASNNDAAIIEYKQQNVSLIDESDDEVTRNELNNNVALRQQIQQEINIFSSIFDIMGAFIQRLRESATNIRDVLQPSNSIKNDNNAVTPGPSVKPHVDEILDATIEAQRNINGQAKPVLLPNSRPALKPRQ